MFNWLANIWTPEGVEIESWAMFLNFSAIFWVIICIIGFIFWRSRRGFVDHIIVQLPTEIFELRKYWWNDVLLMIFLQAFVNLIGVLILARPLVLSLLVGLLEVIIGEVILIIFVFWILTQIWSSSALKYIAPFNIKLIRIQPQRRKS
jgi:hypothetical protein